MAKGGKQERGRENESLISGWSPFRDSLYRALWIAALFSYIGAAMYDVGASWLMTSLAPNPLFVSLIITASTLPIFLLAIPSGAISDIFDRRNILLITCGYMCIVSTILGLLTLAGITTPSILLILTFALGAGATMIRTPIIPREEGTYSRWNYYPFYIANTYFCTWSRCNYDQDSYYSYYERFSIKIRTSSGSYS